MNCLQLAVLVMCAAGSLGGLLPGDAGYQYDRPGFAPDFGRRTDPRFPGRAYNGPAGFGPGNNFGSRPAGYYNGDYQAGYPGYQGNANYPGYQGYQGDGAYQGFDRDNGRPRPYSFQYEVRDPASGNDYGQQESGDGAGTVRGEYRVLLPDSRTQIVRYAADDANGYLADVRYEGQAQYPRPFGPAGSFFPGAVPPGYQPGRGGFAGGDGFGGVGGGGPTNQYLPPSAGSYGK